MTFPFFFQPIWKDSVPIFDGGIYDNFPVGPMKEAFHPTSSLVRLWQAVTTNLRPILITSLKQ
ncbi:MAG: hypothetical protein ACLR6J_07275 [Parabacteroides merdae]